MTIQDAIKKAGPGGKIKTSEYVNGAYTQVPESEHGVLMYYYSNGQGTEEHRLSLKSLTATDWQVVEPEKIEVGDIVKCNCMGNDREAVVIGKSEKEVCIQYKDKGMIILYLHQVDLIHKGPRKMATPQDEAYAIREGLRAVERIQSNMSTLEEELLKPLKMPKVGRERGWHDA